MEVPILKQRDYLIASIQAALTDAISPSASGSSGRGASSSTSPSST
jgi:hypothetical protein